MGTAMELECGAMSQIEKIDWVYLFGGGAVEFAAMFLAPWNDVNGADGLIVSIIAGWVQDGVAGPNTRCQIGRVVNPRPYEATAKEISNFRFEISD